ncbi:class I SAM-dependent methyltransferase [Trueperella sp. LYQ143]|uniref:class I SAM-dependent methyltransferase n=1 Tax=unclassified Trueperella TaxID=2630174 RepID=UPI0039830DB7
MVERDGLAEVVDSPVSACDRLIIQVASEEIADRRGLHIVVADDPTGALCRWAYSLCVDGRALRVTIASRSLPQARQAQLYAQHLGVQSHVAVCGIDAPMRPDMALVAQSVDVMIGRTPKSHAELHYLASALQMSYSNLGAGDIADVHRRDVKAIFGAHNKHMDRGHNAALAQHFSQVYASRGRGKFRALIARELKVPARPYRPAQAHTAVGQVYGVGGVFHGAGADPGGQLLARCVSQELPRLLNPPQSDGAVKRALACVDLGCGNGTVSLALLRTWQDMRAEDSRLRALEILATDIHSDAVASAELSLASEIRAGHARVTWDDAAASELSGSADVVALNPPFHAGSALDMTCVQPLLAAAARLLRPKGELYIVFNSHLRYRAIVQRYFVDVSQIARDRRFTVLRAVRDADDETGSE